MLDSGCEDRHCFEILQSCEEHAKKWSVKTAVKPRTPTDNTQCTSFRRFYGRLPAGETSCTVRSAQQRAGTTRLLGASKNIVMYTVIQ